MRVMYAILNSVRVFYCVNNNVKKYNKEVNANSFKPVNISQVKNLCITICFMKYMYLGKSVQP